MKRNNPIDIETYLTVRIEQLIEDKNKAQDKFDKMWYNKMIQELLWIQQVMNGKEK